MLGIFFTSVVARMKTTFFGGSSRIFNSALQALRTQHMDFVNNTNFVETIEWRKLYSFNNFSNTIDACIHAAFISCTSND